MQKKLIVDKSDERLDLYLRRMFPEYSRSYFQRLIKDGDIVVNGKVATPHYSVCEGDKVSVVFKSSETDISVENIPVDIIYEDKDLLIINKESGMVVHPACGHQSGTLVNALMGYSKGVYKPLLVHRIDKETSGIIVVTKNERAQHSLVKQFQNRTIKKAYLAIVKGCLDEKKGRIEAPLGRSPLDRKKMVVGPTAKKMAITEFTVLDSIKSYSLVEVRPITGRTHQIRSHMAYIGHPVVADLTYGGPRTIQGEAPDRFLLHAYKIAFQHPSKHKTVVYCANPPKGFSRYWDKAVLKRLFTKSD